MTSGLRFWSDSFHVSPEDSAEQASVSATQAETGCTRTTDVAHATHLRALVAARSRIPALIPLGCSALTPLLDRLQLLIHTATTTFTDTCDGSEQAAATRYLQHTPLLADQA